MRKEMRKEIRKLLALVILVSAFLNVRQAEPINVQAVSPPPPAPCVDLKKTGPTTAYPGDTITYHYRVRNCGDIRLGEGALVYDDRFGTDPIWQGDLDPGQTVEFDRSHTLPQDFCGDFVNHAWAIGHPDPPCCPAVRDDAWWTTSVLCGPKPNPVIDIEKTVSDDNATWNDADTVPGLIVLTGQDVWFQFAITNTGNVTLTNVVLTDTVLNLNSCAISTTLTPSASTSCIIGSIAAITGQHTNTAQATGIYNGNIYTDTDNANYFGNVPTIDVEKHVSTDGTSWQDADVPPGLTVITNDQDVWFRFIVTNGNYFPLTHIVLTDTVLNVSTCGISTTLAPGESTICTLDSLEPVEGEHANTVTVTGVYGGNVYSDTDAAYYFGAAPIIDVEEYVSKDGVTWDDADLPSGPVIDIEDEQVWFRFMITNTGNVTLTNVVLTDTVLNVSNCIIPTTMPPNESTLCTVGPFTPIQDQQVNTARATGDYAGNTYDDTDDAYYFGLLNVPTIYIAKYVDVPNKGLYDADTSPGPEVFTDESINFYFVIINSASATLTNITLKDPAIDLSGCILPNELAHSHVFTCSVGTFAIQGQHDNVAVATGDHDQETLVAQDAANYLAREVFPEELVLEPATITIKAGKSVAYQSIAQDAQGNTWDVTNATSFDIQGQASGTWSGNMYTSQVVGNWTVTGQYNDLNATTILHVEPYMVYFPFAWVRYKTK
jgi:hypothetical protein